ncbi:SCO family protein [Bradyrhizobium liaoningense]|uniref:SCO family protein n=1 Tax=Bradyrhizobium liaoningense TaxID=43992 RepID=UPI001BA554A6|nr:SCO family protein [Bradyrhizobium liaoningense]MBR0714946.1 SCO family protein [Bradyrhizobium liaoningense]
MIGKRAANCLVAMLSCLSLASAAAAPASPAIDPKAAIAAGERAVGRTIGDYRLADTAGAALSLRDYRGKPLVISLVYSACSSVCPPTTQHLIDAVHEAGRVFGSDRFAVLTVGFDARNDTVARMAQFASRQGIKFANWRVASGDAATIEALLNDLGFSYRAVAGGFDHPAQTTILDPDGRIYRHVYGDDFPFPMFMEPMKDVIYGIRTPFSFDGIIDRIRFICTTYDPGSRRYRIDYGLVFGGVIAAFSLIAMGGLILREWFRAGRRSRLQRVTR